MTTCTIQITEISLVRAYHDVITIHKSDVPNDVFSCRENGLTIFCSQTYCSTPTIHPTFTCESIAPRKTHKFIRVKGCEINNSIGKVVTHSRPQIHFQIVCKSHFDNLMVVAFQALAQALSETLQQGQ